tara:strand:- start:98 stop:277 length:180 start_codon:yes stop_codon:yes gene_type:complete
MSPEEIAEITDAMITSQAEALADIFENLVDTFFVTATIFGGWMALMAVVDGSAFEKSGR